MQHHAYMYALTNKTVQYKLQLYTRENIMKKFTFIILLVICSSSVAQNSYDTLKTIKDKTEIELLKQRNQETKIY